MSKPNKTKQTEKLRGVLEKVKSLEGISGYILRSSESASVDLDDSTKIIEYAALSSKAFEAGDELSKTFDLGEVNSVVLQGKKSKILLLTPGDARLSIFMDKNVDHKAVYDKLRLIGDQTSISL